MREGDIPVVDKERTQRGKCETQDEMEFLSVGLDKQPQFRSRDRSQPKRRRRRLRLRGDARFSTPCANLFFPPSPVFSERSSAFLVLLRAQLLQRSSSARSISRFYCFFYCDRLDRFSLSSSLFPLRVVDPVLPLKSSRSYCTQRFVTVQGMHLLFSERRPRATI